MLTGSDHHLVFPSAAEREPSTSLIRTNAVEAEEVTEEVKLVEEREIATLVELTGKREVRLVGIYISVGRSETGLLVE